MPEKEKGKENNDKRAVETGAVATDDSKIASTASAATDADRDKKQSRPALYYLTNLKIFLTFTVVRHHVAVAFSGFPYAPLVIGAYPNWFQFAGAMIFLDLNQSYFMPLFYFISAFFCEASFNRKGRGRFE